MPFRGPNPPPRKSEQPTAPIPIGGPQRQHRGILGPPPHPRTGNVLPPVAGRGGPLQDWDIQGIADAESAAMDEVKMQRDMENKYNAPAAGNMPFMEPPNLRGMPPWPSPDGLPDFAERQKDTWEFGKPNWRANPVPPPPQPRPPLRQ